MRTSMPGNRRGAVLPLVCILLTVLLGAGALAVDLGRLYLTAQEVQTAADAAALAAMRAKQYNPIDHPIGAVTNAVSAAVSVAALNRAAGAPVALAENDVVPVRYDPTTRAITPSSWSVNTTAIQVTAEARPSYVLAGALGLAPPTVRRTATAWLASLSGGNCVRPLSVNYTRFYEEGVTWDTRYSANGLVAPEFDQWDIANTQYPELPRRTFTVLPPDTTKAYWQSQGFATHGNWRPAVLGGGTGSALNALTVQLAAPEGSAGCAAARAVVGDIKPPVAAPKEDAMAAAGAGMAQLCHQAPGSSSAWCFNTRGTVGVKTRILFSDSIPQADGTFVLRVRAVGVVRIMCYVQQSTDECNPVSMNEPQATGTWEPLGGRYTGFPPGTMMMFIDSPGSIDLTPDVVLGDTPGLTQRLLLVK